MAKENKTADAQFWFNLIGIGLLVVSVFFWPAAIIAVLFLFGGYAVGQHKLAQQKAAQSTQSRGGSNRTTSNSLAEFDSGFMIFPKPLTIQFRYEDREGEVSARTVDVEEYKGDEYIKGYCHTREETRTFKLTRVQGPVTDIDTGELMSLSDFRARLREA